MNPDPTTCRETSGEQQSTRHLPDNPTTTGDIEARITEYLSVGGLFNPELMEHEKVRDLLMDCRAALAAERETREGIENRLGVAFDRMVHDHQRQLAVEREHTKDAERQHSNWERRADDLQNQVIIKNTTVANLHQEIQQLREQLADRDAALVKIANDPERDRCQIAVNALAGIKL